MKTAIDADNSALFVIWTVLDYPKGFDLELDDLPDAIRSLDEVMKKDKIEDISHILTHKRITEGWIKPSLGDRTGGCCAGEGAVYV